MKNLKEFIEVTAMYDGKKAAIRAACIESVVDNAEERNGTNVKFACRTIHYSGNSIDVTESYEEICDMIYNAEM